jgi:hypothetical protein
MERPEGYKVHADDEFRLVALSDGSRWPSISGIREEPKAWNALLASWLETYDFIQFLIYPSISIIVSEGLLYILAAGLC